MIRLWDYLLETDVAKTCAWCERELKKSTPRVANNPRLKYCNAVCQVSFEQATGLNAKRKAAYRERHPERAREQGRVGSKKYRETHKEKVAQSVKDYYQKEKESIKAKNRLKATTVAGRVCESCGITDAAYIKAGKRWSPSARRCDGCRARKKYNGLCVNKVHVMPPVIDYASNRRIRDYPKCLCTPGTIKPNYMDPRNTYPPRIPLEDKDIPEFGYVTLAKRKRDWSEMTTAGEGVSKGKKQKSNLRGDTRKGASNKSPRRTTRGGSPFDIGPRRPKDA